MVILVVLAFIGAWSWTAVFSKTVREHSRWMWTIRARVNPSDAVGKIILPLLVAIVITVFLIFVLINEVWTTSVP